MTAAAPSGPAPLALAAAAALLGAGLALWALWRPAPEASTPVRLSVGAGRGCLALPPAALVPRRSSRRTEAYWPIRRTDRRRPPPQLYVRRLEQLQATPLSGTDGARDPFFSPDGQWIALLRRRQAQEGLRHGRRCGVTLGDAPERPGWDLERGRDDPLHAFSSPGVGLSRVSSAGGTAEALTTPDPAAGGTRIAGHKRCPAARPCSSRRAASVSSTTRASWCRRCPRVRGRSCSEAVTTAATFAAATFVYMHDGTVFAAPFDLDRLELSGPPAPVLEGVMVTPASGGAQFAVLGPRHARVPAGSERRGRACPSNGWTRTGRRSPCEPLRGNYNNIRFSPDGRRLAMDVRDGTERDVWVYEWGRDTMSRLTFEPGEDSSPVWTPDGRRIAFASARADKATPNLYWQRADGTGEAERLTESKNPQSPTSWHPSGKFLAFHETDPQTRTDIMILPMEGDETSGWKPGKPRVFLNSPFTEFHPAFSPDGRLAGVRSDESGRQEVYVRPFPGPGGKWQVSTGGGRCPTWSRTGASSSTASPGRTSRCSWSCPMPWRGTRSALRSHGNGLQSPCWRSTRARRRLRPSPRWPARRRAEASDRRGKPRPRRPRPAISSRSCGGSRRRGRGDRSLSPRTGRGTLGWGYFAGLTSIDQLSSPQARFIMAPSPAGVRLIVNTSSGALAVSFFMVARTSSLLPTFF